MNSGIKQTWVWKLMLHVSLAKIFTYPLQSCFLIYRTGILILTVKFLGGFIKRMYVKVLSSIWHRGGTQQIQILHCLGHTQLSDSLWPSSPFLALQSCCLCPVNQLPFWPAQEETASSAQSSGNPLCWVAGLLDFHFLRLANEQFVPGTGSLWLGELCDASQTICPLWFDSWSEDSFKSMKSERLGQNVEITIVILGFGCPRWYKMCRPIQDTFLSSPLVSCSPDCQVHFPCQQLPCNRILTMTGHCHLPMEISVVLNFGKCFWFLRSFIISSNPQQVFWLSPLFFSKCI